jgi:hypothetical protein
MGEFSKDWSTDTQKQIRDAYSTYEIAKLMPFNDFFQFEEITYNGRFAKLRKQWKDDAGAVIKEMKANGLPANAANSLTNTEAANPTVEFFGSHVLDVLLYKFIPQVAEEARNLVTERIQSVIFAKTGDLPRWSVVAHSLGTAVAHDSLHAMFTQEINGKTLQGLTKAQLIMMIANVSRVLQEEGVEVYASAVRPGEGESGVCNFYLNAYHEWDPIASVKPFRPLDDWPDLATRLLDPERFKHIPINAFQHKNIHALSHYLADPKVHVELFCALMPLRRAINDEEFKNAKKVFQAATPFGQFAALQQSLQSLQLNETSSWHETIDKFKAFFATLKDF